jgi:hypothetical protein
MLDKKFLKHFSTHPQIERTKKTHMRIFKYKKTNFFSIISIEYMNDKRGERERER